MIGEDHMRKIGGVNELIIWICFPRSMSSIVGDIAKNIMSFASIGGEGYTYRKLSRKGGLVKNMMMFKEEVSPHKLMKVIIG
jgi:hypothetical protein